MNYSLQTASDVIRDGLAVELIDESSQVIAEIFRCDRTGTVTFSAFHNDIPFIQVESLIRVAREKLAAFEDGAAFPAKLVP